MTVTFKTLGCKLNQTETAMMVEDFLAHGYQSVSWESGADVAVINTCTVTGRSDSKCRQAIRQAKCYNPNSIILVTGCYSQTSAEEVQAIPEVDYVLGVSEKLTLDNLIPRLKNEKTPVVQVNDVMHQDECITHSTGNFGDQTRAFLKIQNGCDRRCAYCIVPFARGPSRSVTVDKVLSDFGHLVNKGFKEIVLTGVHVGDFGKNPNGKSQLPQLLDQIASRYPVVRIRLSSLDPGDIQSPLFEVMQQHPNICRHFHVALQSGSNTILKAMNRRHSTHDFGRIAEQIQDAFPSFGLGTDIIAGFPGESEDLFHETKNFVEQMPFTYFHVFPFSPRTGTAAASMPDRIASKLRISRAQELRKVGQEKKINFFHSFVGREVNVLFENRNQNGWMGGLTSEYLRVEAPYNLALTNQIVTVKVEKVLPDRCRGVVYKKDK